MPVIVAPADYARWLDANDNGTQELVRPYPARLMQAHPVSSRVNSPANDDAALLSRLI